MERPSYILSAVATGALFLVALACAPFCLVTLLLAINSVNPLQTVTLLSVRVANRSGQDLLITPVGTMGRGYLGPDKMGTKHVLSQFVFKWPAVPVMMVKDLPLKDGAERVIIYDAEGVTFTDLVLCTQAGKQAQVQVARYEDNRWLMSNSSNVFTVTASSLNRAVDIQTAEALRYETRRDWLVVAAVVPPVVCLVCLVTAAIIILRRANLWMSSPAGDAT